MMRALLCALLIFLAACSSSTSKNTTNWDSINYYQIACANKSSAGCKPGDDNINAIGKGKK